MILWVHLYGALALSPNVRGADENECKVRMTLILQGASSEESTESVYRICRRFVDAESNA